MSETEQDYENTKYVCPKCKGEAKIRTGYDTAIVCPQCGDSRILLSFSTNGDMETVVEGTGEYYEIEPTVRQALDALEKAKASDKTGIDKQLEIFTATNNLATEYNNTGREVKAENLANDVLITIRSMFERGEVQAEVYCDQVSMCAAFASARGDYDGAQKVYDSALIDLYDCKDVNVASLKVKRGLLWSKKDADSAETHLLDAIELIKDIDSSEFPDPYMRAIAYDTLRGIYNKKAEPEKMEEYLSKAIDERKDLLSKNPDTPAYKVAELVDSMGYYAELLSKGGDDNLAEMILDEAKELAEKADCKEGVAYAVMNRAGYLQSKRKDLPEDFLDQMNFVTEALEAAPGKDKRLKETLSQAYMFKSMQRDPEDYENLLSDIGRAYDLLLELAYQGDVNEMFLMSTARSYLVLLNMKHPEKAKKVRQELGEIGISQKNLDESSRSSIGNSGKKTRVNLNKTPEKPLPGRRLKKQIKKKSD